MEINGKKYELSARKAKDVLNLQEACKNQDESDLSGFIVMAKVICDSLKSTRERMPFYKRIFIKKITVKYLLAKLSTLEIAVAFNDIAEIEGGKKKVVAENQ